MIYSRLVSSAVHRALLHINSSKVQEENSLSICVGVHLCSKLMSMWCSVGYKYVIAVSTETLISSEEGHGGIETKDAQSEEEQELNDFEIDLYAEVRVNNRKHNQHSKLDK